MAGVPNFSGSADLRQRWGGGDDFMCAPTAYTNGPLCAGPSFQQAQYCSTDHGLGTPDLWEIHYHCVVKLNVEHSSNEGGFFFFNPCLPSDFSSSYRCCIYFVGKQRDAVSYLDLRDIILSFSPSIKSCFIPPVGLRNRVVWNLYLKVISSIYAFETVLWMFWMKLPDQFDVLNQAKDLFEDLADFWVDLNVYIVCTHTLASHWTESSNQTINPLQILTNVNG